MSNVSVTERIGAGIRLTEESVPAILDSLPDDFDPDKRGAVAAAVREWAMSGSGGDEPKLTTGPKGNQSRTDYGRGVDALTKAVKRALDSGEKAVTLRATLSGEGGGSTTIPTDHPLYDQIVALIRDGESE